jgi:hypothetical protein
MDTPKNKKDPTDFASMGSFMVEAPDGRLMKLFPYFSKIHRLTSV